MVFEWRNWPVGIFPSANTFAGGGSVLDFDFLAEFKILFPLASGKSKK